MRSAWVGLLILGVVVVGAGCPARDGGANAESSGGGTLAATGAVLMPVVDDPTITFKIWFKVGSRNDPSGKEGLAYITAQMISEGGTTRNPYDKILEKLYPLASGYRLSVDREMTVLSGRTHKDNLEKFFELLTDAYLHPAFDEIDFKRIQTDALNYLENTLRYASDEALGKAALNQFVFEGTRYAHPISGTVQGVKSLTVDDVRAFYNRHYGRNNTLAALGGGFDDALARRFEATLDALPDGPVPEPPAIPRPRVVARQVVLVDKPDADASISFGFPIDVARGERDFYALWLANSWLGEHRNSASHLYQVIREKRGMNYGDYSYIEAFPNGGRRSFPPPHVGRERQLFEVWIRTLPNEQAHFALRAAMRELQLLVDNGLTEEQFELTRAFLKKYLLHFADTTADRLGYAVDDRYYGIEPPGHLARFRTILDELTHDEVNAAIRRHLQYEKVKIAIVTGDAEALAEALLADTPSPMTYASEKSAGLLEEDEAIAVFPLSIPEGGVSRVPVDEIFER